MKNFKNQFMRRFRDTKGHNEKCLTSLILEIKLSELDNEQKLEIAEEIESYLQEGEYFVFQDIDFTDIKSDYIQFDKYGFAFSIWRNSMNEDIHKFRLEEI